MQIFAFPNRQVIQLSGADAEKLLQRLITQDLNKLEDHPALYACLFTPQGRYYFDFIIFKDQNTGHLMIDTTRANDLIARLEIYIMRADVTLTLRDDLTPLGSFDGGDFKDPRHADLGYRLYAAPTDAETISLETWEQRRISLGVFDGEQDAELERSNADELHINYLNGIDWKKGCYIGQELTARMRYRGSGKKHLYIIEGDDLPENGDKIGNSGLMRSKCANIGLALLKDDEIDELPYKIKQIGQVE